MCRAAVRQTVQFDCRAIVPRNKKKLTTKGHRLRFDPIRLQSAHTQPEAIMANVRFDHYYKYAELTAVLQAWAVE